MFWFKLIPASLFVIVATSCDTNAVDSNSFDLETHLTLSSDFSGEFRSEVSLAYFKDKDFGDMGDGGNNILKELNRRTDEVELSTTTTIAGIINFALTAKAGKVFVNCKFSSLNSLNNLIEDGLPIIFPNYSFTAERTASGDIISLRRRFTGVKIKEDLGTRILFTGRMKERLQIDFWKEPHDSTADTKNGKIQVWKGLYILPKQLMGVYAVFTEPRGTKIYDEALREINKFEATKMPSERQFSFSDIRKEIAGNAEEKGYKAPDDAIELNELQQERQDLLTFNLFLKFSDTTHRTNYLASNGPAIAQKLGSTKDLVSQIFIVDILNSLAGNNHYIHIWEAKKVASLAGITAD